MIDIDTNGVEKVEAMIGNVRAAGLTDEADLFHTTYWAWLRMAQSYVCARPYIQGATGHIDSVMDHWPKLIPGSPLRDDAARMMQRPSW